MKTESKSTIDGAMARIVNAFLKWPLPQSVAADGCATRPGKGRTGTNLMTVSETLGMVQEVVRPVVKELIDEHGDTLTIQQRDEAEDAADNLASTILGEPIDWPDHGAKWEEARERAHSDRFDAQWYPCGEMLPLDGEHVLAAWDRGNEPVTMRTASHYERTGWQMSGNIKPKTPPTHWRKLPSLR